MTVFVNTNRAIGTGNGSATVFSFSPIVAYAASNIVVTHVTSAGVQTLLAQGVGANAYAVVMTAGFPGTGSIRFPEDAVTPMPTGEKIVIEITLPLEQGTDLQNQGAYFPDTLETQLDKQVKIDIQQQEQINRSLRIPKGDSITLLTLPAAADRASKFMAWSAAGQPIASSGPSSVAVSSAMEPVVTAVSLAAARTAMGITTANDAGVLNATLHSTPMVGDGATDNTAAFDSAVAYCVANDLALYLPPGTYLFNSAPAALTSQIEIFSRGIVYLHRNYSPGSSTEAFFDCKANHIRLRNLIFIAATGTGGHAINCVLPSDGSFTADWCEIVNCRVSGNGASAYWQSCLYLDGVLRAGGSGIRDWDIRGNKFFDVAGDTVYAKTVVNFSMSGGGIFQGSFGPATARIHIDGASGATSQYVNLSGGRWAGTVELEWTANAMADGILDSAITIDANSSNVYCLAAGRYSVTNNGANSQILGGNQLFVSGGFMDLRGSGAAVLHNWQRTDTHGSAANISDKRSVGRSSVGASVNYSQEVVTATDATSGSEDATLSLNLMIAGVLTTVYSVKAGFALGSAVPQGIGTMNVQVGYYTAGTKVVDTRKTGWTPATGTAARTTFATHTAQVITNPPTQAEVQAIDGHLVVLSQRLKALIDDLHATAGHGLIGT